VEELLQFCLEDDFCSDITSRNCVAELFRLQRMLLVMGNRGSLNGLKCLKALYMLLPS